MYETKQRGLEPYVPEHGERVETVRTDGSRTGSRGTALNLIAGGRECEVEFAPGEVKRIPTRYLKPA